MASGDLSNQVPIVQGGGFVKESIIGGMPGPLPDSQQRHWIPDDRDNFISWLRGEFAAANAIIDTLCHHLQVIGKPGEYDFVLSCIQQRRYNWTIVLHMQQYFSVAEVVFALQQVLWLKQALNSDSSGLPPLFVPPENGGGPAWKEDPVIYRDPRGESLPPGPGPGPGQMQHHNSLPKEGQQQQQQQQQQLLGRKESLETPHKLQSDEQQGFRRRSFSGDQDRQQQQQQSVASSSAPDSSPHPNRSQVNLAEQQQPATRNASRTDSSFPEPSSASTPASSSQGVSEAKEQQKESSDQGSNEQGDWGVNSSSKLEASEGHPPEKSPPPYFHIPSKEEDDRRRANVKMTKAYTCFEQIDGRRINTMDGLELHERVLDKLESSRLAALIQDTRVAGKRGSTFVGPKKGPKGKGRELIQFGHSHHAFDDHKRRSYPKDDAVLPVPPYLEAIIDRLVRWRVIPASKRPDCCSINIMEEGDYLPPHLDNSHLERPYCALTVQSDCALVMGQALTTSGPGDFKGPLQMTVPVGSVVVLQRNSADVARHSIAATPSKRIFITLGKVAPTRSQKGYNPSTSGLSQSSPISTSVSSSNSWGGHSYNHGNNNRQGNNNHLPHNSSSRSGYSGPFKNHKYTPVSSSSSSSGGVLPNPTPRPPPPAQIITNPGSSGAPPLFPGTPGGPSPTGGAFAPIPTWSPLPRPPPPSRLPSAGTGVFFPSGGTSSGPGRPANSSTPKRSGSSHANSAPPLLQKTNSAPASFASLEAAALAATAASPSTPPSRPSNSKPATIINTPESSEKGPEKSSEKAVPSTPAPSLPPRAEDYNAVSDTASPNPQSESKSELKSESKSETNGAKIDVPVSRNSGRPSKAMGAGNTSRPSMVATGGHS